MRLGATLLALPCGVHAALQLGGWTALRKCFRQMWRWWGGHHHHHQYNNYYYHHHHQQHHYCGLILNIPSLIKIRFSTISIEDTSFPPPPEAGGSLQVSWSQADGQPWTVARSSARQCDLDFFNDFEAHSFSFSLIWIVHDSTYNVHNYNGAMYSNISH